MILILPQTYKFIKLYQNTKHKINNISTKMYNKIHNNQIEYLYKN